MNRDKLLELSMKAGAFEGLAEDDVIFAGGSGALERFAALLSEAQEGEPVGRLFLGGVTDNELDDNDVELSMKSVERLQAEMVKQGHVYGVWLDLYTVPPSSDQVWNEAREAAKQFVLGRLAGRDEGSELWLEIHKIASGIDRLKRPSQAQEPICAECEYPKSHMIHTEFGTHAYVAQERGAENGENQPKTRMDSGNYRGAEPSASGAGDDFGKRLSEFSEWFCQRNIGATGGWRAAAEDAQHQIDDLISTHVALSQQSAQVTDDRFFMDHGLWHDRVTGQHLYTQGQYDEEKRLSFKEGYDRRNEELALSRVQAAPEGWKELSDLSKEMDAFVAKWKTCSITELNYYAKKLRSIVNGAAAPSVNEQWLRDKPTAPGWYETKRDRDGIEITLWWSGKQWKASPHSPQHTYLDGERSHRPIICAADQNEQGGGN